MTHFGFVILADLVTSRAAEDRAGLATRLETALAQVKGRYEAEWIAPFVTVRGIDELSGVLGRPEHAFDIMVAVQHAVHPERFRFSLASGAIDVGFETGDASDMDGPAFHRAADAIERAETEALPLAIELDGIDRSTAQVIEALAALHGDVMHDLTDREAEIVMAYRELGTQRAAAARLGVTQQAISDGLRRAREHRLAAAEAAIRNWLASVPASGESGNLRGGDGFPKE